MASHRPIAKEGTPFIGISLGLTVSGWLIHPLLGAFFSGLTLFVVYFFRNPVRHVPSDKTAIISPADGKIIKIGEVISIFMSPMDPHVNRVPVGGTVESVSYNKGKFLTAFHEKASFDNEQNAVVIRSDTGEKILFVQIAGWLARRIVCYLKPGVRVAQGDVFGLIRFGSRMDVHVPVHYAIQVKMGDRVKAGETVLAKKL